MRPEQPLHSPPTWRATARVAAMAAMMLIAGCSTTTIAPAHVPASVREESDPVSRLLAYHRSTQALNATDLARERRQLGAERSAMSKMQLAVLALHPRGVSLPRARALLESVLAAQDAEARTLHDIARLLLEQVNERQRLDSLNERLAQQLERATAQIEVSGRQLEETRVRAEELQRKLDALAEIERDLSPSPAAPPTPAAQAMPGAPAATATDERRPSR